MSTNTWLAGIAVLACGAILGLYQPEWRLLFYIGKPLATLAIIALGGGAILRESVRESIRSNGALTVYLHASMECIWSRLETSSDRPLLGKPAEPADSRFSKAARLFEQRLPVYQKECDIRIDAEKDPASVVQDVLAALGYGG